MEVLANTVLSHEPCNLLRKPGLEDRGHPLSAILGKAGTCMRATWPNHFQHALRMVTPFVSHSAASNMEKQSIPKARRKRIRLCPLKRPQLGDRPRTRAAKSGQDRVSMSLHKTQPKRESKRRRTTTAVFMTSCPRPCQHTHHTSCPTYPVAGVMIMPTIRRQQTTHMTNHVHTRPSFRTTSHWFTHRDLRSIRHNKKTLCLMRISPLAPILQSSIE